MQRTSKSPRKVTLEAFELAKQKLPAYSHRLSPKKFTQHQLFALLVLKLNAPRDMAKYEQLYIAHNGFTLLANIKGLSPTLMSVFTQNPVTLDYDFSGDITNDNDRWTWVENKVLSDWSNMDVNSIEQWIIDAGSFTQATHDRFTPN
jgi:hypothetical protein